MSSPDLIAGAGWPFAAEHLPFMHSIYPTSADAHPPVGQPADWLSDEGSGWSAGQLRGLIAIHL
jgi:hypothetical protein